MDADTGGFTLPSSEEITRRRPLRRLAEPWLEREHLYDRYATFLDDLVAAPLRVVPLREFAAAGTGVVSLRHDVDDRLDSALVFAELEAARGIRATYFVLHTAPYYASDELMPSLLRMQELGHEIGFHSDLVTLQVACGGDPRRTLAGELARLRGAGVDIVGIAAHGSYWGHKLGYKNEYFFRGLDAPSPGFPNATRVGDVELQKGTLDEFGLVYDSSQLETTDYWTDSWTDARGHRWHPRLIDIAALGSATRAIILVHSCHWDRSLSAKAARTIRRLARRAVRQRR